MPMPRTMPIMARLVTLIGLSCLYLCLLALATAAETDTKDFKKDLFADYVKEDGKKIEVADPLGDPNESDTVEQDKTAAWQQDMIMGLFKQRQAEQDFIAKLEIGGKTLNSMVNNITSAFKGLEAARQQKGSQLIKEHFENEVKLLQKSQKKVLSDLASLLEVLDSDSAPVKALKSKVLPIIQKNFKQQIVDESDLFEQQISQIKEEHKKQKAHVKLVFGLIKRWKNTFRTGLKKSEENLEQIMQSWDLL